MSSNNSENFDKPENPKKINKYWKGGFLTLGHARDIVLVALLIIITWKLLNSKIAINLESFSFNDFLSVTLALFAISLSVAFYFKATDTSNKFYDNSYAFTKEISEILGRIEAEFGTKLKHIDDGNVQLRNRFDKMPFNFEEAKEKEKEEEEQIKEQEGERDKLIHDLIKKAEVADGEKEELLKKFQSNSEELIRSTVELESLKKKINRAENSNNPRLSILKRLIDSLGQETINEFRGITNERINDKFVDIMFARKLPLNLISDMKEEQFIHNNELTRTGIRLIKSIHESRYRVI